MTKKKKRKKKKRRRKKRRSRGKEMCLIDQSRVMGKMKTEMWIWKNEKKKMLYLDIFVSVADEND